MSAISTAKVRGFELDDASATAQIFYDAVRHGTTEFYSAEQRAAWAVDVPELESWRNRLQRQICFVAEIEENISGFMTLDSKGYVDLAFVSPKHLGQGIGASLYCEIERTAIELGLDHLTTEASLVAFGLFRRLGWQTVTEQTIIRHGVELNNVKMEKHIGSM